MITLIILFTALIFSYLRVVSLKPEVDELYNQMSSSEEDDNDHFYPLG